MRLARLLGATAVGLTLHMTPANAQSPVADALWALNQTLLDQQRYALDDQRAALESRLEQMGAYDLADKMYREDQARSQREIARLKKEEVEQQDYDRRMNEWFARENARLANLAACMGYPRNPDGTAGCDTSQYMVSSPMPRR